MMKKLVLGDCRNLIKDVPDNSVDLILTDPPYVGVVKDKWDQQEIMSEEFIDELHRVMKPSASIYVWCGIGEKSSSLMRWWPLLNEKFYFKDLITWKKRRGIGMRKGWLYTREEIMWFVKDNKKFIWNKEHQYSEEPNQFKKGFSGYKCKSEFKRIANVWIDIPEVLTRKGKNTSHATPKPGKALERIILCHTQPGDLVLDPFSGSGSSLIAANKLNRNFLGFEQNEEIYTETKGKLVNEN
jgi:site-specific DNA-methyltransferase (adenine-specific)